MLLNSVRSDVLAYSSYPHMPCTRTIRYLCSVRLSVLSASWVGNIHLLSSVFDRLSGLVRKVFSQFCCLQHLSGLRFCNWNPPYNFPEGLSPKSDGGQFATPFRDDSFWVGTVQGVYKSETNHSRIKLAGGTFRVPFIIVALVFGTIRRDGTWSKSITSGKVLQTFWHSHLIYALQERTLHYTVSISSRKVCKERCYFKVFKIWVGSSNTVIKRRKALPGNMDVRTSSSLLFGSPQRPPPASSITLLGRVFETIFLWNIFPSYFKTKFMIND